MQGHAGRDPGPADATSQALARFQGLELLLRVIESLLLRGDDLGHVAKQQFAVLWAKLLELGHPGKILQRHAPIGELLDTLLDALAPLESEPHQLGGHPVHLGLEHVHDGLEPQLLHVGRIALRQRVRLPQRVQRQLGVLGPGVERAGHAPVLARAALERPQKLAHAGAGLALPARGQQQRGPSRRVVLEMSRHVHQGLHGRGLVRAGRPSRDIGRGVVERLENGQLLLEPLVAARDETVHVPREDVGPGHLRGQPNPWRLSPLGELAQVAEQLARLGLFHPEAREVHRRQLQLVLEETPGGRAAAQGAVHVDDRPGAEHGGVDPVLGRVQVHEHDGAGQVAPVEGLELAVAAPEHGPLDAGLGQDHWLDGVHPQREQLDVRARFEQGQAALPRHLHGQTEHLPPDERLELVVVWRGGGRQLLEILLDERGRLGRAGRARAAVAHGGQLVDDVRHGGRRMADTRFRPHGAGGCGQSRQREETERQGREQCAAAPHAQACPMARSASFLSPMAPTEMCSSSRRSTLSTRPSRIQTTRSETLSIL